MGEPAEMASGLVEKATERLLGPNNLLPRKRASGTPMTAGERGEWIDTEGSVSSFFKKSGRSIGSFRCNTHVVQEERAPLDDYREGAIRDGIRCGVYPNGASGAYHAVVPGIASVDKEIRLTCCSIRTLKRRRQILRFYEMETATERRRQILYHNPKH